MVLFGRSIRLAFEFGRIPKGSRVSTFRELRNYGSEEGGATRSYTRIRSEVRKPAEEKIKEVEPKVKPVIEKVVDISVKSILEAFYENTYSIKIPGGENLERVGEEIYGSYQEFLKGGKRGEIKTFTKEEIVGVWGCLTHLKFPPFYATIKAIK